jgi:RNA-directed DNA polymerase
MSTPASTSPATPSGGRLVKGKYGYFVGFNPAMSGQARKAVNKKIRHWHLARHVGRDLSGLAKEINPQVRGWINYCGAFPRSELGSPARHLDQHLVRWAMHKYKRLRGRRARAWARLNAARRRQPRPSAHRYLLPLTERRPGGAVWTGDCHLRL